VDEPVTGRSRIRALLAPIALVLSIAPVALVAVPLAREEHEDFARRYLDREALPAPDVATPPAELPSFEGGVPVLVYHGIGDPGRFSVSQEAFARQLAMMDAAGVETITVDEYAAFVRGEPVDLPPRPLLLTFDDGKVSSFRGADAVLERYGMNAVIYAIAGEAEEGSEYYLSADELAEMEAGGRWEVQPHAGDQQETVYDAAGDVGPAYAYRAYSDEGGLESFAEYRRRVLGDIDGAVSDFESEIDGFEPQTFAFPFGAYGQYGTNDRRIPRALPRALGHRFAALFAQPSDPSFTVPGPPGRVLDRFEVRRATRIGELRAWLATGPRELSGR
jgi:peptidoglycan/xylan/chitin deacetylase (PgdA/CDA1 family)